MKKHGGTIAVLSVFLIFVLLTVLLGGRPEREAYLSSDTSDTGTHALFLLLREFGFQVSQKTGGGRSLQSDETLLLIGAGTKRYSAKDFEEISAFVRQGGVVVVTEEWTSLFDHMETSGVPRPDVPAELEYKMPGYYEFFFGDGRFLLIPIRSAELTNRSLRSDSAAEAKRFLDVMWRLHERPLRFEDYMGRGSPDTQMSFEEVPFYILIPETLRYALLLLGALLFTALLFYGKRLGPPETLKDGEHRLQNEDVEAFSGLMERSALSRDALLILYRDFFRSVCGRPPSMRPEDFLMESGHLLAAFSSRGFSVGEVMHLTREAERLFIFKKPCSEKNALFLAELMDGLFAAIRGKSTGI